MRNTLGDNVTFTLWGESHNEYIGGVLDGICAGIKVDEEFIKKQLLKRRPQNTFETSRIELDNFKILGGVYNGYTTGEPIAIIIENKNIKSSDYESIKNIARPAHADYVSFEKYQGYNDYRGGGHFSGRITAPIVALGSILLKALENKNIHIATHIKKCGGIEDKNFDNNETILMNEINQLKNKTFPVIDNIEFDVKKHLENISIKGDSIGGVLQTVITGLPVGIGNPWFSSVEGKLANAIFSVGGVKGIEFGAGFKFSEMLGSVANDEFYYDDNKVKTKTNYNAGINGGITNGMPIIMNIAIKPTPSISLKQNTVDFINKKNTTLEITGRHDPAIIRRIAVVIDSIVAFVVCDMLAIRYGEQFLNFEEK